MIIERSAFYNCMNLEKIYMPDSVASLDSWVFEGCANLTVYCPEDSYTWEYCEATGVPHEAAVKQGAGKKSMDEFRYCRFRIR
jgi:hypothetical protein